MQPDDQIDYDNLDGVTVKMDLQTLGELAVDITEAWCEHKGIDLPMLRDKDGKFTKDANVIASAAWYSVLRMNDRRAFAESIMEDLESLPQQ